MKINQTLGFIILGLGLSMAAACSTSGKKGTSLANANSENGIKTAGLGQEEGLGGVNGSSLVYYFDYDKSEVHESDKPSIQEQARYLAAHPEAKVVLEGHTDPRGSHEYNIALGERRAKAVQQMMELEGASKNQVRSVSYGAEKLASSGHSEEDYQRDRRAHVVHGDK